MTTATSNFAPIRLPRLDLRLLTTVVVAGAFATLAFDLFGQFVSPLLKGIASPWLGAKLAPVPLANAVLAKLSGVPGKTIASLGIGHGLHLLTGLLIYPMVYVMAVRPLSRLVPVAPWWAVGTAFGVGLWVFALYVMAHLVAGNPPFLGWGSLTWVALWGHIVFGAVVSAIVWWREERRQTV